jgi:hypothetical protein
MSEQIEAQENKGLSLDEAFFEYMKKDIYVTRDLFLDIKDTLLNELTKLDDDNEKIQIAFIIGKIHADLLQLVDVVHYVIDKLGIQDNNYRYYVVNTVKALAKAYLDIAVYKKPLSDVKYDLQRAFDDIDDVLSKIIANFDKA